jgi:regulator of protease activity HflC (stomatin/prohibitin superfamily)
MRTDLDTIHDLPRRRSFIGLGVLAVLGLIVFLAGGPFRTVPAGHVGVKDFFGQVSSETLPPGIRLVFPLTRVIKMSVQTQEMKEVADVPSKEGLILSLETSLLFQLDPTKAADIYRTVGSDYQGTIVEPQFRSAIREITASYEAKSLYSAEREKIAGEIFALSGGWRASAASSCSRSCSVRSDCRRSSPTRFRKSCAASRKPSR